MKARAESGKPDDQRSEDMIQWLMDRAKINNTQTSFRDLASTQLIVSLAAIFTSSMAATHVIYDLAARPEYLVPLREEILGVLQEEGGAFTKAGMLKMRKLDSFLKESQRQSPFALGKYASPHFIPFPIFSE